MVHGSHVYGYIKTSILNVKILNVIVHVKERVIKKLNNEAEWQCLGINGLIMILSLLTASGFAMTVHAQSGDVTTIAEFSSRGTGISKYVQGESWVAQTFTPQENQTSYWVTHVKIRMLAEDAEGTVIVAIRDSEGDTIGDTDLTYGTISASQLTTQQWYLIQMVNPYELETGKQYAIVIRAPDVTNYVYPLFELNYNKQYTQGAMYYSHFNGSLWLTTQFDLPFQVLQDDMVIPEFPAGGMMALILALGFTMVIIVRRHKLELYYE